MYRILDPKLQGALQQYAVQIALPKNGMLQLNAVPVGEDHSKSRTNVLFCSHPAEECWRVFVDDDFRYTGAEPSRAALYAGERVAGWRELTPPVMLQGDIDAAILRVLGWLDSPVCEAQLPEQEPRDGAEDLLLDPHLRRVARYLPPGELAARTVEPTAAQADLIARIPEVLARRAPPFCPILVGGAGCSKSTIAAMAAAKLVERGVIGAVLEVSGAKVCAGSVFLPQRDERLRQTLETALSLRETLVVLEQFDLAIGHSETAQAMLADCLDRGLRLIGVTRAEFSPDSWTECPTLLRRLEVLAMEEPNVAEVRQLLLQRLEQYLASNPLEVAPEVVPTVLMLAPLRPGANPGSAVGLLEAVLAHAACSPSAMATPDDLYHIVPHAKS
ncbi:MAG: hypothetical protein RBS80_14575 [Thermoguttaceae bacterium]|jgi:hypothetical protein|nr:hypothetical protein [Thermoguttaceae bacterium]